MSFKIVCSPFRKKSFTLKWKHLLSFYNGHHPFSGVNWFQGKEQGCHWYSFPCDKKWSTSTKCIQSPKAKYIDLRLKGRIKCGGGGGRLNSILPTPLCLKISFSWGFLDMMNLEYRIYPKIPPLLFIYLLLLSTSPFYCLWVCVKLLNERQTV